MILSLLQLEIQHFSVVNKFMSFLAFAFKEASAAIAAFKFVTIKDWSSF